jgi:hypothetical protein
MMSLWGGIFNSFCARVLRTKFTHFTILSVSCKLSGNSRAFDTHTGLLSSSFTNKTIIVVLLNGKELRDTKTGSDISAVQAAPLGSSGKTTWDVLQKMRRLN